MTRAELNTQDRSARQPGWSPEWEINRFSQGKRAAKYVWSDVVTLTFRYLLGPKAEVPRSQIRVLELGCGAGANLLFFAREGLDVTGIDASPSAIRLAAGTLATNGHSAALEVGDFANALPFPDASFDLVLDRATLTHNVLGVIEDTVGEVHRVLKPGGILLIVDFFSTAHPHAEMGKEVEPNTHTGIPVGMFQDIGNVHFTTGEELRDLLSQFTVLHMEHKVYSCMVPDAAEGTAQYNVVARVPDDPPRRLEP